MYEVATYNERGFLYNGHVIVGTSPSPRLHILEVRNSSGELVAILENAYDLTWEQTLNQPPILMFSIPADDSKVANIVFGNELWLYRWGKKTILEKFRPGIVEDAR